jgi:hypothetical protein
MMNINRSMFPLNNNLYIKLKSHCESKFDLYKKLFNDFIRKNQSKHVSFDGLINLNNNNSSNKYRRTETHSTSYDTNRKSSF